ncbi:transposable element Tcb2 transposase [Trichonephila clavipes]|nr:transposable element Tcb2 transposase [Trichonephila clavipes]
METRFDESRVQLNRADGRVKVWRQPHESMDPTFQQGTVQACGSSVMVRGVSTGQYVTPHMSRIATHWLQEHSSEFRHFRWSPKSPDMNINEYIWNAFQSAAQKRSLIPPTPTDLWTALQDLLCQLPPALLQTLIECIPRWVVALLRVCGRLYTILERGTSFFALQGIHILPT